MRETVSIINVSHHTKQAILVDQDRHPIWWPTLFSTLKYRCRKRSIHTARAAMEAVSMARNWARGNGKTLEDAIIKEKGFTEAEYSSLANHLNYFESHQDYLVALETKIREADNVSRIPQINDVTESGQECNTVSLSEAGKRIKYVALYCEFLLKERANIDHRNGTFDADLHQYLSANIEEFSDTAPHEDTADDESLEALDILQCKLIESAFAEDSDIQLFKRPFVKARNYLIWRIFVDAGPRIFEVVEAKIKDVNYSAKKIHIRHSKTRARTVPLQPKTVDAFDQFVENYWSKLPISARRAGWLWTDEKGKRLSEQTISNVFKTIREKTPDIPEWVTSHTMRRSWNDRFSQIVDEARAAGKSFTEQQEISMRCRLMGWVDDSPVAYKYLRRYTRIKSNEILQQLEDQVI